MIESCGVPMGFRPKRKGMKMETILNDNSPGKKFNTTLLSDPNVKLDVFAYDRSDGFLGIYFLAFRDGKLVFWGYPHEFARSTDPYINEIGKSALKDY